MKKITIASFLLSVISITGLIIENIRLASLYEKTDGKGRALFGMIEYFQPSIKVFWGFIILLNLILICLTISKKESRLWLVMAMFLWLFSIVFLVVRFWRFFLH